MWVWFPNGIKIGGSAKLNLPTNIAQITVKKIITKAEDVQIIMNKTNCFF
jgi:hypothetical protein